MCAEEASYDRPCAEEASSAVEERRDAEEDEAKLIQRASAAEACVSAYRRVILFVALLFPLRRFAVSSSSFGCFLSFNSERATRPRAPPPSHFLLSSFSASAADACVFPLLILLFMADASAFRELLRRGEEREKMMMVQLEEALGRERALLERAEEVELEHTGLEAKLRGEVQVAYNREREVFDPLPSFHPRPRTTDPRPRTLDPRP